jgi:hypothetical protein
LSLKISFAGERKWQPVRSWPQGQDAPGNKKQTRKNVQRKGCFFLSGCLKNISKVRRKPIMENVIYNDYMIPRKIQEDIEEAFGKEKAPVLIKALEHGLDQLQKKNEEQRVLLKAEIKEEVTKDLVTKELFQSEIKRLEEKLDLKIDQKGEEVKNSLTKWIIGLFLAQVAVFVGIFQLLGR